MDRHFKPWTNDEDRLLDELYASTDTSELAEMLDRSVRAVYRRAQILSLYKSEKEYALYKGDELIRTGTLQKIAEAENVQVETIRFYTTNTYKKRIAKRKNARNYREVVCLDA